ncbi:CpsB/CapC family capsule biosynthesis tyrosine phosphatase [Lactiplantibacillus sp. WILCCON 0030]|uniref:Tyrosine-protein phosphatase n=1 Tax=Lactiplantibacillus brownii TaxID=3069269 RepID=A0ABU1A9R6_9LACO|nr:CpsB/CapC family capsule biosynthesis tyrosine phosphatase [Lactiplantibacillus brownii]MDQ7937718.1 CpsB/CapC family capsule biosynthesis tyrosine phosphatase [Lactiplantibacillus brownii]
MKNDNLVDLHCHILPGIDDGSPSLTTSISLAQAAVADGVKYILATPHHMDRNYVNHRQNIEQAVTMFQHELVARKIDLQVFPGQEVHLNGHLLEHLDDLLGMDSAKRYVLLELPHEMVPNYLEEVIYQLACQGIVAMIAHPERNAQILAKPEKLYDLIQQGCLAQVTATSLVGTFGKQVQRTAKEFVKCGLVQIVASDAHVLPKRDFALSAAYDVLAKMHDDYPKRFKANAQHILNGELIDLKRVVLPHQQHKFHLF